MSDFDLDGLFVEPRPDEDAWEAFLDLALERIGGDRSPGLTNKALAELEDVLECRLPFEVGLLLVMGVPAADGWHQWRAPADEVAEWDEQVIDGICFAVEHDDFWFDGWGPRPASLAARFDVVRQEFVDTVPSLFPLFGRHAIPLTPAQEQDSSDGNPILFVDHASVAWRGDDLAGWMHQLFEVPLPMWPAEQRRFPFWSDLAHDEAADPSS